MQNLKTKYGDKALVTGASSGIGKAFALQLAQQGITPILIARTKANLNAVAEEILTKYQIKAPTYSVDLSDEKATLDFFTEIENQNISLLVHSAGMENNGSFTKINRENELKLLRLNVTSTYLLTHHFAQKMTQAKKGGILLVSSMAGLMALPYFSNYAATKSYVHNLGLSLYAELKEHNVDISVLAPGLTATNMTADNGVDWGKMPMMSMKASEAAEIALSKLGKNATIIPGFMNKMMVMNGMMVKRAINKDKI